MLRIAACCAAALILALAACSVEHNPEQAGAAPEHAEEGVELFTLPGLDHGLIQSPVNILTHQTAAGQHQIVFNSDEVPAESVTNTGHSVQLNFAPGATLTFDGTTYNFQQCHFHTPSEHQIDGVTYPMEMHCVHLKPAAENPEAPPEYLVGGFLFKMGDPNKFIDEFLRRVPQSVETADLGKDDPVYLADLLDDVHEDVHYYFYRGSLTTPPYTETVTWLLLEHIFEASPEQIQAINRVEGDNARHVQALYGREVEGN